MSFLIQLVAGFWLVTGLAGLAIGYGAILKDQPRETTEIERDSGEKRENNGR